VISGLTGGTSITCRRSSPASSAPDRPAPQPAQQPGSYRITRSGRSASSRVLPGCPFGRPGLRPVFLRSDFGAGLPSPSEEGGRDEFFELDCTRAVSSATCACRAATSVRNSAICASRSPSSCRSLPLAARSAADSPGTWGISGTCRTPPEPAQGNQGDTPGRLKKIKKPRSKERCRDLSSYHSTTLTGQLFGVSHTVRDGPVSAGRHGHENLPCLTANYCAQEK
jgi:hypothetical protein